ncbi:MAG: SH3 domain-containing protein [Alphaproteobacteria bacterium]|nr:SH3 domain-containing protein [Alphaproteobacteria bacterium]MBU1516882.1 SH3 domain-containing protein [Alphaproteobacteria bacterium]MBU2092577.1 SH3 domain-containing protein [Alphaproteobacteria bacterium]MBU2151312.1 SH3 domain-containing protein [Alphaproteobacteria bacterium]MBU2309614.1 SH3 domain-containing protein [Alphaproteobacteria bacterium]
MRNLTSKTIGGGVAAAILAGTLALGGASSASAGVTGCSAPGGKQEAGAVIGAVLGGVIGNKVGGRHATGETVAGAALGAAAGSAVGCEAQKSRAKNAGTYTHNGYRLQGDVSSASYSRIGQTFVAESGVNLRAAPTTNSGRVGRLQAGQRFQALAQVRGSDWVLVGQNGVGVGYVRGDFVRPAGSRYAAY